MAKFCYNEPLCVQVIRRSVESDCRNLKKPRSLAAMQPYFLPNVNFFNLISKVDVFVVLDTVSISKRVWIKSNYFRLEGGIRKVSIPLKRHSHTDLIKDVEIHDSFRAEELLARLSRRYSEHESWDELKQGLDKSLGCSSKIGSVNYSLLRTISQFLQLNAEIVRASDLNLPEVNEKNLRIRNLCEHFGVERYVNNESGVALYDEEFFGKADIAIDAHRLITNPSSRVSYLDLLMLGELDEQSSLLPQAGDS